MARQHKDQWQSCLLPAPQTATYTSNLQAINLAREHLDSVTPQAELLGPNKLNAITFRPKLSGNPIGFGGLIKSDTIEHGMAGSGAVFCF